MARITLALIAVTTFTLASQAGAVPVSVSHTDLATCDSLLVPPQVDELGDPVAGFPPDEIIAATSLLVTLVACPPTADPGVLNTLVSMTNLTPFDFDEVWYVADPETSLTNVDGLVNGEEAFLIDMFGINTPLVAEIGGILPGVFEAGETWDFIIDGYLNALGLPAHAFGSVGLVGAPSVGDIVSSGSIIAIPRPLPEPHALVLVGLALAGTSILRRKRS